MVRILRVHGLVPVSAVVGIETYPSFRILGERQQACKGVLTGHGRPWRGVRCICGRPGIGIQLNFASDIRLSQESPNSAGESAARHQHTVQFYQSDTYLLQSLRSYLGDGLRNGDSVIVVATEPHREGLVLLLEEDGFDISRLAATGRYVSLDADTLLSAFMRHDEPDVDLFDSVIGDVIARASAGGRPVRVFGEMVSILWLRGRQAAALRLEELWNDLQRRYSISLCCGYPMDGFAGRAMETGFTKVCAHHSHVQPAESYRNTGSEDERLRSIAHLQQQTAMFEREAETALQTRNDFLVAASHDLRTPLSVILGYAQMLGYDAGAEGRIGKGLKSIERRARLMAAMVEDLMDAGRLGDGEEIVLRREMMDLAALVEEMTLDQQKMFPRHHLQVQIDEAPLVGHWDQARLTRLLLSLLGNALKYSPDGGRITVHLARERDDWAVLSVQDEGIGIPADDLSHIYERYFRGANAVGATAGTGIGLSTAQQIVEQHGGTITAESTEGHGSKVVVRLPLSWE